jgi:hypothetical protein
VTLAATRAGIDKSSAYQARRRNPAFATSWDRALTEGRAKLTAGLVPASDTPRPRLLADQIVRATRNGRACIARASAGRWSIAAERAFLTELTATANVKAAARAAGVSATTAYNRKRQWPAFAAAWAEAQREGYDRVEMLLICAATTTLDPEPPPEPREGPEMSVDQAMNLLKVHRAGMRGGKPQRYDWRRREPDIEEVRAEVLRRLAVMDRAEPKTC